MIRNLTSRTCLAALILAVCVTQYGLSAGPTHEMQMADDSVYSPSLHRYMVFRVISPSAPASADLRMGLFLLHGFGGDHTNWSSFVDLPGAIDTALLVIISPNGENSWYVNSVTDSLAGFENAIVDDVYPAVMRKYHIDSSRVGVAGFSMGGFGALSLGLRHPEKFRFVGAMSASLDVPFGIPDLELHGRGGLRLSMEIAVGTDAARWNEFDLVARARALKGSAAPYLYLVTGIKDEYRKRLSLYRTFADSLRTFDLAYEFHEVPGRHDWKYCRQEIGPMIRRMLLVFSPR